jgi:hypothetical protein
LNSDSDIPEAGPSGTALGKFGAWVGVRRNCLLYGTFGFGGLSLVVMFYWLRIENGIGGLVFWLVLSSAILLGGYVWSLLMWQLVHLKRKQWQESKEQ